VPEGSQVYSSGLCLQPSTVRPIATVPQSQTHSATRFTPEDLTAVLRRDSAPRLHGCPRRRTIAEAPAVWKAACHLSQAEGEKVSLQSLASVFGVFIEYGVALVVVVTVLAKIWISCLKFKQSKFDEPRCSPRLSEPV
jgi:hypothetical protein